MTFRICLALCSLACWCLLAHPAAARAGTPPPYWYDGHVQRPLFLSSNQVTVFPSSAKNFAKALQEREVYSDANVLKASDFATYLRVTPDKALGRSSDPDRFHSSVKGVSPVFFTTRTQSVMSRLVPTGNIVVQYKSQNEAAIAAIEQDFGLTPVMDFGFSAPTRLYAASDPVEAIQIANAVYESADVAFAAPDWLRERQKKDLPNDPLFNEQWLLHNTGQTGGPPGIDISGGRLTDLWSSFKGSPQEVVAIVDDGIEIRHPDLAPNVNAELCWDFIDSDDDPTPTDNEPHGTACAGLAAGRGFNGLGITGSAPWAGLAGIRVIGAETDVNTALSETLFNDRIDIYSNSWGPIDDGDRLEGPGPLLRAALAEGVAQGRGGLGSIYVWAAGNGGQSGDNSNYDGYANSRFVLAVTGTDHLGRQATYAEPGANIALNVPSSGGGRTVTTTDLSGFEGYNALGHSDYEDTDYTNTFGGTSAACPTVAGVAALMLQANPELTWREVRTILMRTAVVNDPEDADWTRNGAGLPVNHKYGFGRVDALGAVEAASAWISRGEPAEASSTVHPDLPIPDNDPEGVSFPVHIEDDFEVEFVELTFSADDHPYWGDLQVELVSPQGTVSVLAESHYVTRGSAAYRSWRFGSVRHLGERSQGTWTLVVSDRYPGDTGTFQSFTLRLHGWDGYSGPVFKTVFPHIPDSGGWTTEIGLLNADANATCTGLLKAYDAQGQPVSTPLAISLPPLGRRQIDTGEIFPDQREIASMVFESDSPKASGYLKFSLPGVNRAAVAATTTTASGDLLLPHIASTPSWWTGVALTNTSVVKKTVVLELNDGSSAQIDLGPRAQRAFLIRDLFGGHPLPQATTGRIRNADKVAGLMLFGNDTQLAGVSLSDQTRSSLVFPHIADDESWWTGVALHNPANATAQITLTPHTDLASELDGRNATVAAGQSLTRIFSGLELSPLTTWFQAESAHPLTGLELFATTDNKALAGLNTCTPPSTRGLLPKLEPGGLSWLGMANTSNATAGLTCRALDNEGHALANATRTLPPFGRLFLTPGELFPEQDLTNATHVLYDADAPLATFQINGSPSGMMLDALPGL
ncbi:MAG: S8 family serine peptidase [Desulfohalobiaceae bacterium]